MCLLNLNLIWLRFDPMKHIPFQKLDQQPTSCWNYALESTQFHLSFHFLRTTNNLISFQTSTCLVYSLQNIIRKNFQPANFRQPTVHEANCCFRARGCLSIKNSLRACRNLDKFVLEVCHSTQQKMNPMDVNNYHSFDFFS